MYHIFPFPILVKSPPYRFSSSGILARGVQSFVARVYLRHFLEAFVVEFSCPPQQIMSPFISTHLDVLDGDSVICGKGPQEKLAFPSAMNLVFTTFPEAGLLAINIANRKGLQLIS